MTTLFVWASSGLGSMGRNHLRNLSSRDDCVLAAVADPAPRPRGGRRGADRRPGTRTPSR